MNAREGDIAAAAMISGSQALAPSRIEDRRLVTGTGKFTADWSPDGLLHAVVVRSDRAHARIMGADWSAARAAPGVVAVLTAEDVAAAGFNGLPTGAPLKGRDGQPIHIAPMPILATDRVRYVGQPVAMIIADSVRAAQDAAELVSIDYDDLPAVSSIEAASADGAPQLHEQAPGNLVIDFDNGDAAAVEAAFARAAFKSKAHVVSQRLVGSPMELRAVVVSHDAARNMTTVYTPTQGIVGMTGSLAAVTGIPATELEVIAQDVGGSFGLRGGASAEHALLILASRRLKRPVKWVATRGECFIGEWHGRALVLDGEIALDADGSILAIRFQDTVDLGAYTCYWGAFIGTRNIAVTMGGVYKVPALYMRSRLWFTNTVPVSAYRGAGRPDIAFAIERLMDEAAAEHGLDRLELRRKNFIPPEAFPYTTANGTVYDCGDFAGVLDDALVLSDWAGFEARRAEAAKRGRLRGIGLGCYLEASGGGGAKDLVSGQFDAQGRLTLYAVSGPSGQGHETSFTKIVGDALGLPVERISYRASVPGRGMVGNGTGGSRTLYGVGSAFKVLAQAIAERARPHAAAALGVAADSLGFADGRFSAPGGASVTLTDLVTQLAGTSPHPLDCQADATTGMTFPNGCHVAEIEIDPATGVTEVVAYTAVDDLGNVVSPALVRGQVHGGVVQGLGQAFGEQAIYDEGGQLLTGSYMDYPMPKLGLLGEVRTAIHAVPTKLNPLGAKGVGESGCSGSLPAVSNAMTDALRSRGLGPIDMPYTPPKVWAALRAAS